MRKINKFFAAAITLTALIVCTYSQNVRVLTLSDAVLLAKQNNSDYILAKLDQTKAGEQVSEVYAENLLPNLSLSSQYIRAFKKQVIEIFGQTYDIQTDNEITSSINASEPIPILGTPVFSAIKLADYYSKLQGENVTKIENSIKANVKKAFYNVLLEKEVIDLQNQSLSDAQENLRVVEARYKAGVALEFDYIRAKVKVESILPDLHKSENDLEIAKKSLKNTIGLKDNSDIDTKGVLTYDSTEVFGSMDNIIRNVSEKNVALRQLNLTKSINSELEEVTYSDFLPKFYIFGQYGLTAYEDDGVSLIRYRYYNVLNAGIGLNWNLNLFGTHYKDQQSKIEVMKTEEQIRDTKEKLKTQAESILLRIEDAKSRITAQKQIVDEAEEGLELATVSFKSGVLNQIDVIDAEFVLSQTRLAYVQAIYDYLNARTDLEELMEK